MLVGVTMLALKTARREILPHGRQRVGRVRRASPDRIREKRAAVRNVASAQLVYIGNNPLSGKDPTGYASTEACESVAHCAEGNEGDGAAAQSDGKSPSAHGSRAGNGAVSQSENGAGGAKNAQADAADKMTLTNAPTTKAGEQSATEAHGSITGLPPSWHERMQAVAGQSWATNPLGAVGTDILDSVLADAFQIYGASSGSHYNAYTEMSVSGAYPGLTAAAGLGLMVVGGGEGAVEKEAAEAGVQAIRGAENRLTYLYQKVGSEGEHLKFGITNNPATRYTQEQLGGGRLKILTSGSRADMLQLERNLHETLPIGPEERQSFYIQKQVDKGLNPPPYEQ
jgi:hypothetical protein